MDKTNENQQVKPSAWWEVVEDLVDYFQQDNPEFSQNLIKVVVDVLSIVVKRLDSVPNKTIKDA